MDVDSIGEQTAISAETHAYSGKELQDYPTFLAYLLLVKRACAWANSQLNIISSADFAEIDQACREVSMCNELFTSDVMQGGGGIAVHMNINEALCHQLGGPEWFSKVNASQSTTDVCSTALSLALTKAIHQSKSTCFILVTVLKQLVSEFMHFKTIGRTCLRDASEISQGERFSGFVELFTRQSMNLERYSNFAYSNLGATALGTGEGIDPTLKSTYRQLARERLSELTGLEIRAHAHLIDSVQNRDDLYDLASVVESMVVSLLKMAKDIRLLASGPVHGFNEIELPQIIKGSSFYRNKINPTLDETVIQMSFMVLGLVKSAKLGIEHAELDMNIYYMHSAVCLLDAFGLINNLLPKYMNYHLTKLKINKSE